MKYWRDLKYIINLRKFTIIADIFGYFVPDCMIVRLYEIVSFGPLPTSFDKNG